MICGTGQWKSWCDKGKLIVIFQARESGHKVNFEAHKETAARRGENTLSLDTVTQENSRVFSVIVEKGGQKYLSSTARQMFP